MQPEFYQTASERLRFPMRNFIFFIFVLIICFGVLSAAAQDDPPIKVESSIVRLNVGVVDKKGRAITKVSKEDFTVYEEDVKQ